MLPLARPSATDSDFVMYVYTPRHALTTALLFAIPITTATSCFLRPQAYHHKQRPPSCNQQPLADRHVSFSLRASESRGQAQAAAAAALLDRKAFFERTRLADLTLDKIPVEKAVALSGALSFKQARNAVRYKRVQVDGLTCDVGMLVGRSSALTFNGTVLPDREPIVYYLLNKHRGCMSVAQDGPFKKSAEGGTVLDFAPLYPRVFPIGRLDYDSEGLIMLTNDGSFAAAVLAPEYGVKKVYMALIESKRPDLHSGVPSRTLLADAVANGVRATHVKGAETEEPELYTMLQSELVSSAPDGTRSWVKVVLDEGKNREVRKLFAALGYKVLRLYRTEIGPFRGPKAPNITDFEADSGSMSESRSSGRNRGGVWGGMGAQKDNLCH